MYDDYYNNKYVYIFYFYCCEYIILEEKGLIMPSKLEKWMNGRKITKCGCVYLCVHCWMLQIAFQIPNIHVHV